MINPKLILDITEKKRLRKALGSNTKITDVHHALMKIKVADMKEIILDLKLNDGDNLIFYLASYRNDEDVKRYKDLKEDLGSYAKKIKFRPTLLVGGEKEGQFIDGPFYDVCLIKPPPDDNESTDPLS